MPLPAAPAGAINFLMGGPQELAHARAVPSPDHLSGPLRDAARDVRRAVTAYDQIHASGRALVQRRREVHAADERAGAKAMGAGKQLGEAKLLDHDDQIADHAERLSAAAGAVIAAVRELEAVDAQAWERNASRIGGQVAHHVTAAEESLATARDALKAVAGIASVQAWVQRRPAGSDSRVSEAVDAVDRAQELAARVRDGDPAPEVPDLVAPAHSGLTSAWRDATAPIHHRPEGENRTVARCESCDSCGFCDSVRPPCRGARRSGADRRSRPRCAWGLTARAARARPRRSPGPLRQTRRPRRARRARSRPSGRRQAV